MPPLPRLHLTPPPPSLDSANARPPQPRVVVPLELPEEAKEAPVLAAAPAIPRPRSISPLRVRLPVNARKRPRITAAKEVDEPEEALEAPAPTPAPRSDRKFISVAAGAAQEGIPKQVLKAWVAAGFIETLRPGSDASHRLVESGDLRRFVELKREHARADVRRKLEQERGQQQQQQQHREEESEDEDPDSDDGDGDDDDDEHAEANENRGEQRTLLYARVDGDDDAPPAVDDTGARVASAQQQRALHALVAQLKLVAGHRAFVPRMILMEVGRADNLHRPKFASILWRQIACRKIDRLVLLSRQQACDEGAWPLFEMFCRHHGVTIVCADELAAPVSDQS